MEHDVAHPSLEAWLRKAGVVPSFVALAELLPEVAVAVVDASGRVLLWSEGAERLVGTPAEAVLGRQAPVAGLDLSPAERHAEPVRLARPGGGRETLRHHSHLVDGGAIHVLVGAGAVAPLGEGLTVPADAVEFHGMLSRDPAMLRVFQTIRNVAETDVTVLVRGESGTGKELVAHAIHEESYRRGRPFIAVNCAAFTPSLLESELFGHVKGAYTGATGSRRGIFAQADGGTLFLDEVAELSPETQVRLLRVLQERTLVPVGGTEPVTVDVRVIAATHKALRQEVKAGRFREDLMYRLRVVPLFLPALRQRRLDVELLLRHFLAEQNAVGPRHVVRIAPSAMRALLEYPWPGNVRELQNVVQYAFAVGRDEELTLDDLPPEFRESLDAPAPSALPTSPGARDDERTRLVLALTEADGDLELAARRLGVSRTTFWRLRRRHGL